MLRTPIRVSRAAAATRRLITRLAKAYPDAWTELRFRNPYELLVATVLSAQTTDARVNEVTAVLFGPYPDALALARAAPEELEPLIRPTGFFRTKSRTLVAMARHLVERHQGTVPASLERLVELPGVGRKTANVVLGHALGVPALGVDRHVLRVANRLGVACADDPGEVEEQLCAALPRSQWTLASDVLILHGRRVCRPRPLCLRCGVRDVCQYYRSGPGRQAARRSHGTKASPPARSALRRTRSA